AAAAGGERAQRKQERRSRQNRTSHGTLVFLRLRGGSAENTTRRLVDALVNAVTLKKVRNGRTPSPSGGQPREERPVRTRPGTLERRTF
ncbi:MAG TPA: hypothetical protein VFV33_15240, partial [Gemmatimonadaceae bacterium]|nr:hypothetical protein [Gemmatimonadaceae bacterium]